MFVLEVLNSALFQEASGEKPEADNEKTRKRREDEVIVGSGQEEGSGEEAKKPSVRRSAEEQVESSGHKVEGSGQA
jgi:hypothetical protein